MRSPLRAWLYRSANTSWLSGLGGQRHRMLKPCYHIGTALPNLDSGRSHCKRAVPMTRGDRSLRAIPKSVASLVSNQSSGGDSSRPDVGCATTAFRQLDHLAEAGKGRPMRVNIGPPYATCQPLPSNGTVAQAAPPFRPVPANCTSNTPERFAFNSSSSSRVMPSSPILARQPAGVPTCPA